MSRDQKSAESEKKEVKKRSKINGPQEHREDRLRKKLKEAKQEISVLKDRLLRTAAEMDNYRKRTEREISQLIESANSGIVKELLPVIDDLERSLNSTHDEVTAKEFRKGIELIYQKLISILRSYGLKKIESLNTPFDVELHDALMQVEKKGVQSGLIIEEHEKGYYFKDKVLRHAKVIVSK
ncbi:nucleotide exchange factor GrpE [bacterium]|nr:nucleotide exchange factor GrpE [bacterium]